MGVYHLICVSEDGLREWPGGHDELLRDVGSAVVTLCLDSRLSGVKVCTLGLPPEMRSPAITVRHIDSNDCAEFTALAWGCGGEICLAEDIDKPELVLLNKVVNAVLNKFGEGEAG